MTKYIDIVPVEVAINFEEGCKGICLKAFQAGIGQSCYSIPYSTPTAKLPVAPIPLIMAYPSPPLMLGIEVLRVCSHLDGQRLEWSTARKWGLIYELVQSLFSGIASVVVDRAAMAAREDRIM